MEVIKEVKRGSYALCAGSSASDAGWTIVLDAGCIYGIVLL